MTSRAEVTSRYARAYVKASKKDKGRVRDHVVEVTGWSRDNARRRLTAAASRSPGAGRQVAKRPRKPRSPKYSYDTLKVLQLVWAASGGQCGKYLPASMRTQLDGLERHGELAFGGDRYSPAVRKELLAMSAASIDRYLKGAKATDQIMGVSTTKPSPLLRSSIKIRKAGDEVEAEPGFFEGDTVAHCGPTLKGEFARTLNLTDAHTHILGALKAGVDRSPDRMACTGGPPGRASSSRPSSQRPARRCTRSSPRPCSSKPDPAPFGCLLRLVDLGSLFGSHLHILQRSQDPLPLLLRQTENFVHGLQHPSSLAGLKDPHAVDEPGPAVVWLNHVSPQDATPVTSIGFLHGWERHPPELMTKIQLRDL